MDTETHLSVMIPIQYKGKVKIILSTNIAEASVAIPDVLCVVDSGASHVKT